MSRRAEQMLDVIDVAERLAFSEKQVRRWVASGELHSHRMGRKIRVSEGDLASFVAMRRT